MKTCIVQLGRLGDILNILPMARWLNAQGDRPTILVHRDFMDLAQSVSYADFEVVDGGDYRDLDPVYQDAIKRFSRVYCPQLVLGRNKLARNEVFGSFCKQAYARCGMEFDPSPIIIDRRYPEDEAELVQMWVGYNSRFPVVLVNTTAVSNPPPIEVKRIMHILRETFEGRAFVTNLSNIRSKRFTDLLGLYDRAKCLVTVDTATLHLAGAHTIPYVALLADQPTPWFGSYCRGNVIHKARYGEAVTDPDFVNKIVRAVESTL